MGGQQVWGTPVAEDTATWGTPVEEDAVQPASRTVVQSPPDVPSDASLYWRALTNPVGEGLQSSTSPLGAFEQVGGQAIKAAAAVPNMLLHPIDTLKQIKPWMGEVQQAHPIDDLVDAGKQAFSGNLLPAENIAGSILGGVEGGRAGAAAAGKLLPASISEFQFRPKSSTAIVSPEEQAARNLAYRVGVHPTRAQDYIKAAQKEVPNILDYAKRTNNPLNTLPEFSKAAEGNALESRAHYENNVLGPYEDYRVPAPPGSKVKSLQAGENPQNRITTLGNIDDRIVQVNKDLDIHKANPGDVRAGLASEADLLAEKAQLTKLLHRSLSDLNNIPPEQIADLRERVGRSWELANDTNQAMTARGLAEFSPGQSGVSISSSKPGMVKEAFNYIRGGPTAIADRDFQRAIRNFPGEATPLPEVAGPVPQPASPAGRPPTPPPAPQPYVPNIVNTADPAAQMQTRAANLSRYQAAQQAEQAAADAKRAAILRNQQQHGKTGGPSVNVPSSIIPASEAAQVPQNPRIQAARASIQRAQQGPHAIDLANIEREAARNLPAEAEEIYPNPGDRAGWQQKALSIGGGRTVPLGDEEPPLSQADEDIYQVHNINSAVEQGNQFNATKWRQQNPGGDVESAKQQARDLGYKIRTPAASTPETHQFDAVAWSKANPNGDVVAAIRQARAKGYRVINEASPPER